jgi:CNT family concentrative nucleoside transporter
MGYLLYPFALVLGIPPEDAVLAAQLIGERAIVTEITAYQDLNLLLGEGAFVHDRSPVIITYALCGFAHVASMAIFVGGVSAVAPKRTRTLARIGFRALLAATIACLLTACVSGVFFSSQSLLLGQ